MISTSSPEDVVDSVELLRCNPVKNNTYDVMQIR